MYRITQTWEALPHGQCRKLISPWGLGGGSKAMLTAAWQPPSPAPNRRAASRWPYSSSCMPAAALRVPILSCFHHYQGAICHKIVACPQEDHSWLPSTLSVASTLNWDIPGAALLRYLLSPGNVPGVLAAHAITKQSR